jgi:hypothetical protein
MINKCVGKVENIVYSVVIHNNKLRCINTSNGSTINSVQITGEIITGPIVTGDRCVIVVKMANETKGRILKLPSLSTTTTFNA